MADTTEDIVRRQFLSGFSTSAPYHAQITQGLISLIQHGTLPNGATLPSERRMAEVLGVSRITVQHSYNELRKQMLISSHGRRGSVVQGIERQVTSPMNRLRGFTQEMKELGRTPTSRIVEERVTKDIDVAAILGLQPDAPLLKLHRIRYADGIPMSNERAWYNLEQAPFLQQADLTRSVYSILAEHGMALATCDQTINAVMASDEDQSIFGFDALTPCILIKRRSFSRRGAMLEYVEGRFRGDVYSYRLTLNT